MQEVLLVTSNDNYESVFYANLTQPMEYGLNKHKVSPKTPPGASSFSVAVYNINKQQLCFFIGYNNLSKKTN